MKKPLKAFWAAVERNENRLDLLRKFARRGMRCNVPLAVRRRQFQRKRHWKILKDAATCWCCRREKPRQRHHIIPLLNGGSNDPKNIVPLCIGCHERVHPWMEKPLVELPPELYTPIWRSVG